MARDVPWLLRGTPVHPDEIDYTVSGDESFTGARKPRPAKQVAALPLTLADRVQDVARQLTDDFVNGRTDIHFNTFRNRSRILWRRVARLRRAHRIDLLS